MYICNIKRLQVHEHHYSRQHDGIRTLYLVFRLLVTGETKDLTVLHSTLDKIFDRHHILDSENSEVPLRQTV